MFGKIGRYALKGWSEVFRLWIRVLDADGDTSTFALNFPNIFSLTEVIGFATGFIPLVDAIIHGCITEAGVTVSVTLPGGIKLTPDANCDVQHGAQFAFRTENAYVTGFRLPSFMPALFAAGSKNVDTEDLDVDAFLDALRDGIDVGGTMIQPSDYRGDDIQTLIKGVESFRK